MNRISLDHVETALTELGIQVAGPSTNPTLFNRSELAAALTTGINKQLSAMQFGHQDTPVAKAAKKGFES